MTPPFLLSASDCSCAPPATAVHNACIPSSVKPQPDRSRCRSGDASDSAFASAAAPASPSAVSASLQPLQGGAERHAGSQQAAACRTQLVACTGMDFT